MTEEEQMTEEDPYLDDSNDEDQIIIQNVLPHYHPDFNDNDLCVNNNPIKLDGDDLLALYSLLEPNEENFGQVFNSISIAPYKTDFKKQIMKRWWCLKEGNSEEYVEENWLNNQTLKGNRWLFDFLNCLPQRQRNYMLETYFNNTINDSAQIETYTHFSLTSIRHKDYRKSTGFGIRVGEFMTDLVRVAKHIDVVPSIFLLKVRDPKYNHAQLTFTTMAQFNQKLKSITLGKTTKAITAYKVLQEGTNTNFLTIEQMAFYTGRLDVFQFFQGFDYPLCFGQNIRQEVIQPFLSHIFAIICKKRKDVFNYVISWISYIIQNIGKKTKTALVITGMQGTGKNTFTDTICKLFGGYANPDAKLDYLTGKFNGSLMYKMLLVCNEVKSFIGNKKYDDDTLKTLITEESIDIHKKYQDVFTQQNVANFIFLSNNFAPIKIAEDDRRYIVMEVSAEKRGDKDYFNNLYGSFTPDFFSILLSWFRRIDLSQWDPTIIPLTREKTDIINFSKNPYSAFIQLNVSQFIHGIQKKQAFESFKAWCTENGYAVGTMQAFRNSVLKYCRETKDGSKAAIYQLREDAYQFFQINK